MPTHLIILEPCYLLRAGLRTVLAAAHTQFELHEADDAAGVLSIVSLYQNAVLLVEPRQVGRQAEDFIGDLASRFPHVLVLIFTNSINEEEVYRYIKAGARGFLLKSAGPDEIMQAICEVAKGSRWMPPAISTLYVRRLGRKALTSREMDILAQLAYGMDNLSIAERLKISPNTVKNHMTSLFNKLEARDRLQALSTAMRRGLISMDAESISQAEAQKT